MEDDTPASKNSVGTNKTKTGLKYVAAVLSAFSVCLLVVIIMLVTFSHLRPKPKEAHHALKAGGHEHPNRSQLPLVHEEPHDDALPCLTKEGVMASSYILSKMDFSVNPCEDMYLYACGRFLTDTKIPDQGTAVDAKFLTEELFENAFEKIFVSNSTKLHDVPSSAVAKMKTFYRDCMDTSSLEEERKTMLLKVIGDLGSWTMSDVDIPKFDGAKWSLRETLTKLHKMGFFFFFSAHKMTVPGKGGSQAKEMFFFTQEGQNSFYERCKAYHKATLDLIFLRAHYLGGDMSSMLPKLTLVMQLIYELRFMSHKIDQELISLRALQEHMGGLDLQKYLQDMFGLDDISSDTQIFCPQLAYFISLGNIFRRFSSEVIANFLMINLIEELSPYLPGTFQNQAADSRESDCRKKTLQYFPTAFTAVYVENYFQSVNKAKVVAIGENIKKQIVENFKAVDWLDDTVKEALVRVAQSTELDMAYPDWILDPNTLDKVYRDVKVAGGELVNSVISVQREIVRQVYQQDPSEPFIGWWPDSDAVTAKYIPHKHVVIVPTPFLQPPSYSPHFPTSFVYGSMGATLGHEFMHGFDSENGARSAIKDGKALWHPGINNTYMHRARCLTDQYNAYSPNVLRVNDYQTFDEDMCDNEGLRHAYRAYKALGKLHEKDLPALELTHDQLFFLGFAQYHCKLERKNAAQNRPAFSKEKIRVRGTLSNSEAFAEAFGCPRNSPMNPERKCVFF
ncbi:unnamed protein product [Lymnaea stagnalis]|uniref:Uncharacterized protein n=1 Tax=Lymnaea stagnalis TaxID=6523 RepID=A0AAV2I2Y9_LYMST